MFQLTAATEDHRGLASPGGQASAPEATPVPSSLSEPLRHDVANHLVLVGHVLQELSLRVPSNLDRTAMFNHGAMGLLVAARRQDDFLDDFATQALRAIRASMIGSLTAAAPTPTDDEVARLLGVPVLSLRAARAAAINGTAPVSQAPPMEQTQTPRRPVLAGAPKPAFIGS